MYEDFDVFTMGHIHENAARNDVRDTITYHSKTGYRHHHKELHMMLTGTYKEEYGDGSKGWHVERGAPIKPTGGRILTIECGRRCFRGAHGLPFLLNIVYLIGYKPTFWIIYVTK
jgi:hypothetical protein